MQAIRTKLERGCKQIHKGDQNGQERHAKRECSRPSGDDRATSLGSKGKSAWGRILPAHLLLFWLGVWPVLRRPREVHCFRPQLCWATVKYVIGMSLHPDTTEEAQRATLCTGNRTCNGIEGRGGRDCWRGKFCASWPISRPAHRLQPANLQAHRCCKTSTPGANHFHCMDRNRQKKESHCLDLPPHVTAWSEQNCHQLTACVADILISDSRVRPGKGIV